MEVGQTEVGGGNKHEKLARAMEEASNPILKGTALKLQPRWTNTHPYLHSWTRGRQHQSMKIPQQTSESRFFSGCPPLQPHPMICLSN